MTMSDKTYDFLKWVAQIVLPAIGTLYFALASIWRLPYRAQIVGTITAVDAFLGAILKISSDNYMGDGQMVVDSSDPEKDIYSIVIADYPEKLAEKDKVMLKVSHPAHLAEE